MLKHALFFAFFTLLAAFASAAQAPAACVLACVNEESKHSDFKAVCNSENMHPCLIEKCAESDLNSAINHFQTTCKAEGQTALLVDESESTSSNSSSSSNSSNANHNSNAKSNSTSGSTASSDSISENDTADSGTSLPTANFFGIICAFMVGLLCILV